MKRFEDKEPILLIVLIMALIIGIILFFVFKDFNKEEEKEPIYVDTSDVNNVPDVEKRLGNTMKITQNYLLTYTKNKSSIWYMSSAKVKSVKIKDTDAYITLSDDSKTLDAWIEADKINIKKGDTINFVGTVELSDGSLKLSKISVDTINYKNVTEITFGDLVDNIKLVLENKFVIDGYMITDGSKYKLYSSKKSYESNPSVGNYFTIIWKDKFNYTGNANVTVQCNIGDTFKLKDCELLES